MSGIETPLHADRGTLTEGEKYAICKAAFEVYGPLGYAVGNHSSRLIDEVERVLATRLVDTADQPALDAAHPTWRVERIADTRTSPASTMSEEGRDD